VRSLGAIVRVCCLALAWPVLAADEGWFGIGVSIEADGDTANPTVHGVTVQSVDADSPPRAPGSPPVTCSRRPTACP